jgi:hypothetical protein
MPADLYRNLAHWPLKSTIRFDRVFAVHPAVSASDSPNRAQRGRNLKKACRFYQAVIACLKTTHLKLGGAFSSDYDCSKLSGVLLCGFFFLVAGRALTFFFVTLRDT